MQQPPLIARSKARFAGGHTPQAHIGLGRSRRPARTFERIPSPRFKLMPSCSDLADPLRPVDEQRRRVRRAHVASRFGK